MSAGDGHSDQLVTLTPTQLDELLEEAAARGAARAATMQLKPLLLADVEELLGVSEKTIRRMIDRGQLSMINVPGVGWHMTREAYAADMSRGFKPRKRFR